MKRITITIDIKTLDKLHKICKANDWETPSRTIRQLIKEYDLNDK